MLDKRPSPAEEPSYWQNRADEARAQADQMRDPDAKRIMMEIAEEYDHLAQMALRRLAQPL